MIHPEMHLLKLIHLLHLRYKRNAFIVYSFTQPDYEYVVEYSYLLRYSVWYSMEEKKLHNSLIFIFRNLIPHFMWFECSGTSL